MAWLVAGLLGLVGSWMVFDGARALITGDYVTPGKGDHEGQLGPWSALVELIGIPARSTFMKSTFVVIGALQLLAVALLLIQPGRSSSWFGIVASLLGLWYLPFGTIAGATALTILMFSSLSPW